MGGALPLPLSPLARGRRAHGARRGRDAGAKLRRGVALAASALLSNMASFAACICVLGCGGDSKAAEGALFRRLQEAPPAARPACAPKRSAPVRLLLAVALPRAAHRAPARIARRSRVAARRQRAC